MKRKLSSDNDDDDEDYTLGESFDARLKTPFCMVIAGNNQSGKTSFTIELLKNRNLLIDNDFEKIVYFYGIKTPNVKILRNMGVICVQGLPAQGDFSMFTGNKEDHKLFIFDDMIQAITNNEKVTEFVFNSLHHELCSIIFTTQDLFLKSKYRLTLTRQAHYFVLMKSVLDKEQIVFFARKFAPHNHKQTMEMFEKMLSETQFSYIFADGRTTTPDDARLRWDIFNKVVMKTIYPKKRGYN